MATGGGTATSRTGDAPGRGGTATARPVLAPGQTGGGGSGGGGGGGRLFFGVDIPGGDGGGGGGALQISTPGQLNLSGKLLANGAHGGVAFANAFAHGGPGGGGAGGHIELFAQEFIISTNALIQTRGGAGGGLSTEPVSRDPYYYSTGANGGAGYVYLSCVTAFPPAIVLDGIVDDRARILSLNRDPGTGLVSLECRGLACTQYSIQSSTNLNHWLDRAVRTPGWDGLFDWTDETAPGQPECFYRLSQPSAAPFGG